ncbi:MAG: MotA/TolQ/ExbB proton channel family protein [Deltaproteobacteria bacterium]|nr:MotA/TolQ/ExbB proton channel family protein [Deltaproteobacteria bacterium]MBW2444363.1 MotA/TolQ/ExbB proton channel family protein [Deltaproteobacteria bacterium]
MKWRATLALAALGVASALALPALAQDAKSAPKAKSLNELLRMVEQGWRTERAEIGQREKEFKATRSEQKRLLEQAQATRQREEKRSDELEKRFEANELRVAELEDTLRERLGNLGELFGVVRQVAGDTAGNVENSLVSSQITGRSAFLTELGQTKKLPSIQTLEMLWFTLQQEMVESGKVVRYEADVIDPDGQEGRREVIRVGVFNAISQGHYLAWIPEVGKLAEMKRQPASRYLDTVEDFEKATEGTPALAIDPSRGQILSRLVETPSASERIEQGGIVGYAIILLGILAGTLGLFRLVVVTLEGRKVKAQQTSKQVSSDNPLGRVLAVHDENRETDVETLELKLHEAILREAGPLERFLWAIKVGSVVAPLMGLLGTVTGMIQTFQAIVLYGTGDPTTMASGISEALVTTMLGLCVAIPLLLIHAILSTSSRRVVEVLEEQSAGIVAARAEAGATGG